MLTFRPLALAAALTAAVSANAQAPTAPGGQDHSAHHPAGASAAPPAERMVMMDVHMKPMHEGMAMMGGTGPKGAASAPMDMTSRHQVMEERMEVMQSMWQMMMDRMLSVPATK